MPRAASRTSAGTRPQPFEDVPVEDQQRVADERDLDRRHRQPAERDEQLEEREARDRVEEVGEEADRLVGPPVPVGDQRRGEREHEADRDRDHGQLDVLEQRRLKRVGPVVGDPAGAEGVVLGLALGPCRRSPGSRAPGRGGRTRSQLGEDAADAGDREQADRRSVGVDDDERVGPLGHHQREGVAERGRAGRPRRIGRRRRRPAVRAGSRPGGAARGASARGRRRRSARRTRRPGGRGSGRACRTGRGDRPRGGSRSGRRA